MWGSWYVTISTWLSSSLHFTGEQVGIVGGATGVGAIVAPFFVGLVADRYAATEKILGYLHLAGAVLLLAASRQTGFPALYTIMLLYCLCFMPTIALTNSLSFRQMQDPSRSSDRSACWAPRAGSLPGSSLARSAWKQRITQSKSRPPLVLMGLYCFTLPHTPPLARGE